MFICAQSTVRERPRTIVLCSEMHGSAWAGDLDAVRLISTQLGPTIELDLTRALIKGAQLYSWLVGFRRAAL